MAKGKTRLKAAATSYVPQSREQVIEDIKKIGDIQRELTRVETDINDRIAILTNKHTPEIEAMKAQLSSLQNGVQTWCEAHREAITDGNKTKTVKFNTGEVSWRARPISVSIKGVDVVLKALKTLKLDRFIRTKEEINKDAILADKDAVKDIKGITFNKDKEDFSITPFEQEIQ
ncbi:MULTISPECIES: host-nuclease inhibitor Gam family protein [unclassified Serratia (in: enterobacteria)]|uniref:host-nuclease inhibitor Gam family protein n=1 Tax=unclassified Serratia (in: enterobacteria) TaxID=2647522 RepID=UPI00050640C1|nr:MULTISPECIES: host-nuclease inhibitor Gam family protein [unclassified Serratia (in: enterobacteria)]KFK92783.1 host-nuclease inhibitor protein Gam [Serratia sp. Ag2]KFK98549.1 host-nuclease inhibitor protein Gam [Serratia sp. Ag1]